MRTEAYARRKAAHAGVDPGAALAALLSLVRAHPAPCIVSAYAPIRTEIDPTPAMEALARDGYALCLPVVRGAGLPLAFRPWHPGMALEPGAFGAPVPPDDGREVRPDVVIAPLLAFDTRGYRLGYGGGFYDRTLAALRADRPVAAYGFAYQAQRVPVVPVDATDVALDAIATEAGITRAG